MNSFHDLLRHRVLLSFVALCLAASDLAAQSPEELARRRLDSGRAFVKAQNYAEGLKDFEVVLQSYPTSVVADDALLNIATYLLQIARDPDNADLRVKQLLKVYPGSDSAAMALVLEGRIALAKGRGPDEITTAIASFDRVPRLFPDSEAVPASIYFSGEAARLGGRREPALQRFAQVATQFPTSPWTANALLGSAQLLARSAQPVRAMEQLQRVRNQFPNTREASVALDWNTVLYRLFLRGPTQPVFLFSGRTIAGAGGKLKDVADIAVDADGNLLVASNSAVVTYGAKGTQTSAVAVEEPEAIGFDRLGKFMTIHEPGLRLEGRTPVALTLPVVDGKVRQLKATDAVITASGEYLVADRDQKNILRFSLDGKYLGEYARMVNVRRMAINDLDDVVVLDADSKSVTLLNRDGKVLKQITERGANYQLKNPTDVAFDGLGNIYVLERAAVLVFSSDGTRLLTTFAVTDKTAGAFGDANAFALDSAGRLFLLDGRSDSVKVYR